MDKPTPFFGPIGRFRDRAHAAYLLSVALQERKNHYDIIVAIPRGGVVIGSELSRLLHLPLEVSLCKKIGHPGNEELSIGSITPDEIFLDPGYSLLDPYIKKQIAFLREKLQGQQHLYHHERKPLSVRGQTVLITDDGIATGNTMEAVIISLRKQHPKKIVVAVPVSSPESLERLTGFADETVCLLTPPGFQSVGEFYEVFPQVSDKEVSDLLQQTTLPTH